MKEEEKKLPKKFFMILLSESLRARARTVKMKLCRTFWVTLMEIYVIEEETQQLTLVGF